MHYHRAITFHTLQEFLKEIEELKSNGYVMSDANADKRIVFDGKNTVECQAGIYATFEKGTCTYTVMCTI